MSAATTTSHAYGIGVIAVIVALCVVVIFYQSFYLPEALKRPNVAHEILEPADTFAISIKPNSVDLTDGQETFAPGKAEVILSQNNKVIWINDDSTFHTVTPNKPYKDPWSGEFGAKSVMPGESYEFLFAFPAVIEYHCEPHPWMKGTITIEKQRF